MSGGILSQLEKPSRVPFDMLRVHSSTSLLDWFGGHLLVLDPAWLKSDSDRNPNGLHAPGKREPAALSHL